MRLFVARVTPIIVRVSFNFPDQGLDFNPFLKEIMHL